MPLDVSDREWAILRDEVLESCVGICFYCGDRADVVDHITPESRGGKSIKENLIAACNSCNLIKGNRTFHEWARDNVNDLREFRRRHNECVKILTSSIMATRNPHP